MLATGAAVFAQPPANPKPNMTDASNERGEKTYAPGDPILETMTKMRIRSEEKEHAEFIERGSEVVRLSAELNKLFLQFGSVERNAEKLNQLEKTIKKIRKTLGGSDDKDDNAPETNPANLAEALAKLAEIGESLGEAVKTSTRYTISADSIDNTNELLELINFIRRAPR